MQIGDLKNNIATYLGRTTPADFVINTEDTLLAALNNARRAAERAHDFFYSQVGAAISIASTGTLLSAATLIGGGALKIKRPVDVLLPVGGGGFAPVELLTYDTYVARVRRQLGREPYDPTQTLAALGITDDNVYAVLQGQTLFIAGNSAAPITFPVAAQMNVYQFMPDYTEDTDDDFFCDACPEYLFWAAIREGNKFWRRFVPKQEGNVDEDAIKEYADQSLASLIAWDNALAGNSSTPVPAAPPMG